MMRKIFFLSLCFPIFAFAQFSNGFAPLGATWADAYNSMHGPGLAFTTVVTDSTVGNTQYKKLSERIEDRYPSPYTHYAAHYLTVRNDSVWTGSSMGDRYHFLYTFNASVGDSVRFFDWTNTYFAKVTTIDTITIAGQQRRATHYTKYCDTTFAGTSIIIEGIGLLERWDWQLPLCGTVDGNDYQDWCYHDNTISYPQNCTVSTKNTSKIAIKTHFSPNPTNDLLHITANQPFKYLKITDLLGKTQIEKTVNSTETIISTAELPQGVYIGLIDGIFIQKIIVLH